MERRLLVAVDDSSEARRALEHALSVFPDAEVTVFTVIDPYETIYGPGEEEPAFLDERFGDLMADHDGSTELVIETGTDPGGDIVQAAERHHVDGIVVGSRGRSRIRSFLFGSVAEAVVRRASVPVIVVK